MAVSLSIVCSVEWLDYSDWWTGKIVEGSGRDVMEMMSRNFTRGSKENRENSKSG